MSYLSRIVSLVLATSLAVSALTPAYANYQKEEIIRQQREECQRLGGRYEYPRCYLPDDRSGPAPRSDDSSCGVGCAIVIGILGIAARQAYCKANPGKC